VPIHKFTKATIGAAFVCLTAVTAAIADTHSKEILERALSVTLGAKQRQIDRGEAIRVLADHGLVSLIPDFRADYTDYRLVSGQLQFFDYPVVIVIEEYITEWMGCCPDPGIGVIIRGPVAETRLQSFAQTNSCQIGSYTWIVQDFAELDQSAEYHSLHCPDEFE
jgi:hypothetical protein